MSTNQILAELPHLNADDRHQVLQRLCELQDHDLLHGAAPSAREKEILDHALAEFQRHPHPGTPWRETLRQISLFS
jgi:hypothetical protein